MKMITFLPAAGVKHVIVTYVSNTVNAWIVLRKTWMATENCYYKKLLKDNLTTLKEVSWLHFLQRYVQPQ